MWNGVRPCFDLRETFINVPPFDSNSPLWTALWDLPVLNPLKDFIDIVMLYGANLNALQKSKDIVFTQKETFIFGTDCPLTNIIKLLAVRYKLLLQCLIGGDNPTRSTLLRPYIRWDKAEQELLHLSHYPSFAGAPCCWAKFGSWYCPRWHQPISEVPHGSIPKSSPVPQLHVLYSV